MRLGQTESHLLAGGGLATTYPIILYAAIACAFEALPKVPP